VISAAVVKDLIEQGIDLAQRGQDGATAFLIAMQNKNVTVEVVEMLLHGSPDVKDCD
jgi:ankyrin repeat protein